MTPTLDQLQVVADAIRVALPAMTVNQSRLAAQAAWPEVDTVVTAKVTEDVTASVTATVRPMARALARTQLREAVDRWIAEAVNAQQRPGTRQERQRLEGRRVVLIALSRAIADEEI